jgi:hypothetical protein
MSKFYGILGGNLKLFRVIANSVYFLSMDLTTGELRFDSYRRKEIVIVFTRFRPALGPAQPPVQWVPGQGVKHQPHLP